MFKKIRDEIITNLKDKWTVWVISFIEIKDKFSYIVVVKIRNYNFEVKVGHLNI